MATRLGLKILKNYSIENNFSFVVANTQKPSKTDKDFLMEVANKGVIVWEKGGYNFLKEHQEIKPQALFTYSTQNLSAANKRKLLRKIVKMIKWYEEKFGKGVIMVEKKQEEATENIFKECQVSYKKQEIFR